MQEEFSRTLRAGHIKDTPQEHVVTANAAERAALAARFGLPEILELRGVFTLRHEKSGEIAAALQLRAQVTQNCVVSLEPFESLIAEDCALRFVPAARLTETEALDWNAESLEGPDEIPYSGDTIDLGAALAEQLALALDPYPRKPGAELPAASRDETGNPFAALRGREKK